jgi:hypothetical protein
MRKQQKQSSRFPPPYRHGKHHSSKISSVLQIKETPPFMEINMINLPSCQLCSQYMTRFTRKKLPFERGYFND